MKKFLFAILIILSGFNINAQDYTAPMKIPMYLSGSFGELRNNHFHSGIDIKTQSVINKPIYSFADGYISRILVSNSGFGLALYITHPATGQVTVYGHLNSFTPKIAAYVKEKQYEDESFRVNLFPEVERFPVKKGDLIAYSGNSGSSGGPHLHFEVRDETSEITTDALEYFKSEIKDNIPPDVRGVAVYPIEGKGVVNGSRNPLRQNITKSKKGQNLALKTPVQAWGTIGVGVKAYDRMTGTANSYGVKIIRLFVDGVKVYESKVDQFAFSQSRMINSFVDFYDWRRNKSFFMKSFVEPGNELPFFETINNGYIAIDQEKTYDLKYELEDLSGNQSTYSFQVTGKKQEIPQMRSGVLYMVWDRDNHYINDAFSLVIPRSNLYDDCVFNLRSSEDPAYYSNRFVVNDTPVPLHDRAEMRIKMTNDILTNKNQYGIVAINGKRQSWAGGTYADGYITTAIRELGAEYAVSSDVLAPTIVPVNENLWTKQQAIKIKVTDDKSGVSSYRGNIDGKFALFEYDVKSPVYTYKIDPQKLTKGKTHKLVFTASDACGNTSEYSTEFYY